MEKSKLSLQSFAVIAVRAIGKVPPVLSVWEYLEHSYFANFLKKGKHLYFFHKISLEDLRLSLVAFQLWRVLEQLAPEFF